MRWTSERDSCSWSSLAARTEPNLYIVPTETYAKMQATNESGLQAVMTGH